MEENFSLQDLFKTIRKSLGLIALLTILAITIAGVISYLVLTPVYQTSAQLLVNQETPEMGQVTNQNIQTDLQLINTYALIIKSPVILEEVAEELDNGLTTAQITNKITVSNADGAQVVNISVEDPNPALAVEIANMTAKVFVEQIPSLMNVDNVRVLYPAVLDEDPSPVAPNPILNMVVAAIVGLILGIAIAFLRDYLDTTIKDQQDIEDILKLPVLGVVSPIVEKVELNTERKITSRRRAG